MRRHLWIALAVLTSVLLTAAPAGAVRYGEPDNGAHPYVGLVVFYDAAGAPLHRCSGTLLSPTVFLTAGHCTFGTTTAGIYFDEQVVRMEGGYPFTGGITGTPYTYGGYDDFASFPNTGDVGVVVLDEPVYLDTYGVLADVGTLDAMATQRGRQSVSFEVVGYGLQEIKPVVLADTNRLRATTRLVNLRSALTDGYNIHHTNAKGTGGGTCFGDSGGPVFLEGTNVIVAVTSFGLNANCVGGGFGYRVDTLAAQEFIYAFL